MTTLNTDKLLEWTRMSCRKTLCLTNPLFVFDLCLLILDFKGCMVLPTHCSPPKKLSAKRVLGAVLPLLLSLLIPGLSSDCNKGRVLFIVYNTLLLWHLFIVVESYLYTFFPPVTIAILFSVLVYPLHCLTGVVLIWGVRGGGGGGPQSVNYTYSVVLDFVSIYWIKIYILLNIWVCAYIRCFYIVLWLLF